MVIVSQKLFIIFFTINKCKDNHGTEYVRKIGILSPYTNKVSGQAPTFLFEAVYWHAKIFMLCMLSNR